MAKKQNPKANNTKLILLIVAVAVIAVVVLGLLYLSIIPKQPGILTSGGQLITGVSYDDYNLMKSTGATFLSDLSTGNYNGAYGMTGELFQGSITKDAFVSKMSLLNLSGVNNLMWGLPKPFNNSYGDFVNLTGTFQDNRNNQRTAVFNFVKNEAWKWEISYFFVTATSSEIANNPAQVVYRNASL